ncbi:DDE-type integrase/transposase/recombinase [Micromonospora sp. NPDC047467]|uniref:recombinase family protein n=1 Tax=Micromonospora sp. NPDC047467 TaxID=3154814 RepID=UPI0033D9712D
MAGDGCPDPPRGRYLGGRPPYGYTLRDLGPHPNPAKAADGKRLKGLTPDEQTEPIVGRIFTEFLTGLGLFAIAEGLTADHVPCPSAHGRARNPHRGGIAWSKSAVRVRVLNIARQPYYRRLAQPVGNAELVAAHRANALADAHRDDPEFGYRFLVDEARNAGQAMAERTAWKICSDNGWWSAFGKRKKRGKVARVGPPVNDDLVKRDFTAHGPNRLWLADITEHRTGDGKLYLCAIKDMWSNRIVGYCIDSRMKSRLAITATRFRPTSV